MSGTVRYVSGIFPARWWRIQSAANQAIDIAVRHRVCLDAGGELVVRAETLCIHSDNLGAVAMARTVSERLKAAGFHI